MENRQILQYLFQLIVDKTWEKAVETEYHTKSYYGLDKKTQTIYLPDEKKCDLIIKLGHPNAYLSGEPRTSIYFAIDKDGDMYAYIENYKNRHDKIKIDQMLKKHSIKEIMDILEELYIPKLENKFSNIDYDKVYKDIFNILLDQYKNSNNEKEKFSIMKTIKDISKMYKKDLNKNINFFIHLESQF